MSGRQSAGGRRSATADDRELLLQMLEEAFRLPNWNCTSLQAALRRVTPEMAGWRPPLSRRSIADLVVHCAYWKYALRRRLTGGKRGAFPFRGSNWFRTPENPDAETWSGYLELLKSEHELLCAAVGGNRSRLDHRRPRQDGQWTSIQRIFWLAIHDGYHTGQVNLIKAMYRRAHD
jgi:hypothetical protein